MRLATAVSNGVGTGQVAMRDRAVLQLPRDGGDWDVRDSVGGAEAGKMTGWGNSTGGGAPDPMAQAGGSGRTRPAAMRMILGKK